ASAAMGSAGRSQAQTFVLRSKITAPDLPHWAVPRPRLAQLIAGGVPGPPTAPMRPPRAGQPVARAPSAPPAKRGPGPGAGGHPGSGGAGGVAGVPLDEFDNRARVLGSDIVAALRRAGVQGPHTSWSASCVDSLDHEFLVRLASALATAEQPVILVLDDLHL